MRRIALLDSENDDPPQAQASFDGVYAAHSGSVYRFCLAQIGQAEAAADVTHEAFIKAFAAYDRVSPDPETTRTWLLSIARNCCIDYHRQNSRWRRLLSHLQFSAVLSGDVESMVHQRSELERVNAALVRLGLRDRELIGLRIAAELSHRQIAGVLGMSEQAAKAATRRALKKLRSKLEEQSHE